MVDVMVLGNSLQEHGVKAEKVLCINDDAMLNGIADLMGSWEHVGNSWRSSTFLFRGTSEGQSKVAFKECTANCRQ